MLFESDPVRPVAMSAEGQALYVANIPDGRLEVFTLGSDAMTLTDSVPVGLEPVAVAVRGNTVWVVNHLSDSVSIVDVSTSPPRVVRTLLVGDEPRDIVFAGPDARWAFIATAHRGQHSPYPRGEYEVSGVGRADVWVFDTANLGPAGRPATIITLFGDRPRALAVSPDKGTVYAAVFRSGNQTTALPEGIVCDGGASAGPCPLPDGGGIAPGGLPAPNSNSDGAIGPETGLIVKLNPERGSWEDELQRDWSDAVRFELPDLDVFSIDASADPPVKIGGQLDGVAGVGTVLFNMAVNPVSGKVYVSNTEAMNHIRFEGPGELAAAAKPAEVTPSVIGQLHKARITVIDGSQVLPRHLNKHIDYSVRPVPAGTKAHSLATPLEMAVTDDGRSLYVAAFGSARIGVLDTAELENDSFDPTSSSRNYIDLTGGGPAGIVLDESRNRLYVLTRFDNTISAVDLSSKAELQRVPLHNPEPPSVVDGRPFLYDANLTSSNGEASCASCHLFGDMDDLAWDLGDPDAAVLPNPNPFDEARGARAFHPLKGPMTTQSLRGLANAGPMHWRGDRTAGNDSPPGDPLDEIAAFKTFNVAFPGLLGRDEGPLSETQIQAMAEFALQIAYPPNPGRQLNNALRPDEELGRELYFRVPGPAPRGCNGCHVMDPAQGFFGTDGQSSFDGEPQEFKIAHLRNLYQKVGMFGMPAGPFVPVGDIDPTGPQVRGFGFLHDGSVDTLFHFLHAVVFPNFEARLRPDSQDSFGTPDSAQLREASGEQRRRAVEAFLMVTDTGLAPIVGQQITLSRQNRSFVFDRIGSMLQRAGVPYPRPDMPDATECDLVVKGNIDGRPRGFLYDPRSGRFISDTAGELPKTRNAIVAIASLEGQELTLTCVPPGSGRRMAIDRDADGVLDGDDLCPATFDPDQLDGNLDGVGDACSS